METLITVEEYLPLIDLPENHRKILRLLGKGKENSITSKKIQLRTGFSDTRARTLIAQMVNLYGIDIGGGSRGFYIMVTDEEIEEVYLDLSSRGIQNLKRARAIKNNPRRNQFMAIYDELVKEDE